MFQNAEIAPFKEIFEEYYSPLCNYAASILNDRQVAEDVVQQLFIQLWEKQALDKVEHLQAYLLRSTKFKCIDYLRSNQIKPVPMDLVPEGELMQHEFQDEDIIPMLHFFAASLPPKTREVFLLSRVEGYSNQEIADQMEVSIKTVENQMTRALKKLREILKEHQYLSLYLWLFPVEM